MSERQASYDAEMLDAPEGYSIRVRMNFEIQAKGNCKPDVTTEVGVPENRIDLGKVALMNSQVLQIATNLGRRFERVWGHTEYPEPQSANDPVMTMPSEEEIDGWSVTRSPQ